MSGLLTPKDVAEAIGVSESSLKRWADAGRIEATRTSGGHRRIVLSEAVRFIRDGGFEVVRPDRLGLAEMGHLPDGGAAGRADDLLFKYLSEGMASEGRGLIVSLYLEGRSVAEICDGPIRKAMERLGELWQHSQDGIFVEHRATDICLSGLNLLRTMIPVSENGPVAVGGAPSGDPYLLPSIAATIVLAAEGFNAVNLGPTTPVDALIRAVDHYQPAIVWLSASATDKPGDILRHVKELSSRLTDRGCVLVVGGRMWKAADLHPPRDVQYATSMAELAAFARGVAASQGSPTAA